MDKGEAVDRDAYDRAVREADGEAQPGRRGRRPRERRGDEQDRLRDVHSSPAQRLRGRRASARPRPIWTPIPRSAIGSPSPGATAKYLRPIWPWPDRTSIREPLRRDLAVFADALEGAEVSGGFMNAPSPGIIALFQPNEYYGTRDEYLEALADAMKSEYEAIVEAGLYLQIDAPDLAMGRHIMYKDVSDEEFVERAAVHVEAINRALARCRATGCASTSAGETTRARTTSTSARANRRRLLEGEAGDDPLRGLEPAHAHEWTVWRDARMPDEKILARACSTRRRTSSSTPSWCGEICRYAGHRGRTGSWPERTAVRYLGRLRADRPGHLLGKAPVAGRGSSACVRASPVVVVASAVSGEAFLVGGVRTPFGAMLKPRRCAPDDLAALVLQAVLERSWYAGSSMIDEVIFRREPGRRTTVTSPGWPSSSPGATRAGLRGQPAPRCEQPPGGRLGSPPDPGRRGRRGGRAGGVESMACPRWWCRRPTGGRRRRIADTTLGWRLINRACASSTAARPRSPWVTRPRKSNPGRNHARGVRRLRPALAASDRRGARSWPGISPVAAGKTTVTEDEGAAPDTTAEALAALTPPSVPTASSRRVPRRPTLRRRRRDRGRERGAVEKLGLAPRAGVNRRRRRRAASHHGPRAGALDGRARASRLERCRPRPGRESARPLRRR